MRVLRPWPLRRVALPDELFSTWLLRNIRALSGSPHSFCRTVWGDVQFWNRDVDRCVPDNVILELAQYSGTPQQQASQTTLRPLVEAAAGNCPRNGIAPWLLPVGVYHRTRIRYGQQFCPECLAGDAAPHLRRRWRFAYWFLCLEHRCLLMDACLCGAPVIAHRSPMLDIRKCHQCYGDIGGYGISVTAEELAAQSALLDTIKAPVVRLGTEEIQVAAFLSGLRVLLIAMASTPAGSRMGQLALGQAPSADESAIGGAPELLRIGERTRALTAAHVLLQDWPRRFHELSGEAGCSYRSVAIHRVAVPNWLETALGALPRHDWREPRLRRRRRKKRPLKVSWANALSRVADRGQLAGFVATRLGPGQ